MKNTNTLKKLSKETKEYLKIVFSLMDYFYNNNFEVKFKDEETYEIYYKKLEQEFDIESLSFFIAGLMYDDVMKRHFNASNITEEGCLGYFEDEKFPFVIANSIEETESFKSYELEEVLGSMVSSIKYDYKMEETDFSFSNLTPMYLFNYMLALHYEAVEDMLEEQYGISDLFEDESFCIYDDISTNEMLNLATSYGVKVEDILSPKNVYFEQLRFENIEIFYEDEIATILVNNGDSITVNTEDNGPVRINNRAQIVTIDGEYVIDETFRKFTNNLDQKDEFELYIIDQEGDKTFTINTRELFAKDSHKVKEKSDSKKTPNLDKYGTELTSKEYIKDPSIGRDNEIRKIEEILCYPERDKSVIIVGESGVGKTALVEGLAYRVKNGNVPNVLKNLKIISIDVGTLNAGTKYVGTLEEKLNAILNEAQKEENAVIFIDEIHQAISAGKSDKGDNSIAELLKPYLGSRGIRIIGATTPQEYDEYVQSNEAFKSRFKKVTLKEPEEKIIRQIINNLIDAYNKVSYSKFNFEESERERIVDLLIEATKKEYRDYLDRENNPRLVLDIIKCAFAIAAVNDKTEISYEDVSAAIKNEERLYKTPRTNHANKVLEKKETKKDHLVLEFKPRK